MKHYDYNLAIKIVNKMNDLGVLESASLGMHEDWFWTAETVWANGDWLQELTEGHMIGGINRSKWATPVIQVDLIDGTSKTFNCYTGESDYGIAEKIEQEMNWANGCLSGPVQEARIELDIETFEG